MPLCRGVILRLIGDHREAVVSDGVAGLVAQHTLVKVSCLRRAAGFDLDLGATEILRNPLGRVWSFDGRLCKLNPAWKTAAGRNGS
jgi:hypothetical protein